MALTVKIKLLRTLSVVQCGLALCLVVLGIVERARVSWNISAIGVPIWTGVWVGIAGSFGVFITYKRLQTLSANVPSHLVMTFMGFCLTCGFLSGLIIYNYTYELAIATDKTVKFYFSGSGTDGWEVTDEPVKFGARHTEEHALVGSIFAVAVVEFILAMWSVAVCFISDEQASLINEAYYDNPIMVSSGQGQDASGATELNAV